MTAKVNGPSGWMMEQDRNDDEAQALVRDFTTRNKEALDGVTEAIGKALAVGDGGRGLALWALTLRGLYNDLERILEAAGPAVVVKDATVN